MFKGVVSLLCRNLVVSRACFGQLPVLRMHKQPPLETALVACLRCSYCLLPVLCLLESVLKARRTSSCGAGILASHTLCAGKFKRQVVSMPN